MAVDRLDDETIVEMAKALGFDTDDPHMATVYPLVRGLFRTLQPLDKLDLEGVEQEPYFAPEREQS